MSEYVEYLGARREARDARQEARRKAKGKRRRQEARGRRSEASGEGQETRGVVGGKVERGKVVDCRVETLHRNVSKRRVCQNVAPQRLETSCMPKCCVWRVARGTSRVATLHHNGATQGRRNSATQGHCNGAPPGASQRRNTRSIATIVLNTLQVRRCAGGNVAC